MSASKDFPLTEPFAGLLGYHLRRASVMVMADLTEALAPLGLKPSEASVLFVIAATDGATQAEIGRALGIQRANMAPLMANLMKNGLVERQAVDGRSQALRLSGEGEAVHRKAMAATRAHERRLFGALTAEDRTRLIGFLRGLWEAQESR
jgi:DNA-binding MarR family transcriptional regulator